MALTTFFWLEVRDTDLERGDLERPLDFFRVPEDESRLRGLPLPPLDGGLLADELLRFIVFFFFAILTKWKIQNSRETRMKTPARVRTSHNTKCLRAKCTPEKYPRSQKLGNESTGPKGRSCPSKTFNTNKAPSGAQVPLQAPIGLSV